jgi:Flp pilus assembly protein TadG
MKRLVEMVRGAVFGVVRDRRGGVATFLAAAIIPLIAFAGLAVDTSRGYLMKARLSSALDAAALAGGRAMHDPDLRDEMVERFFNANFPANYMGATIVQHGAVARGDSTGLVDKPPVMLDLLDASLRGSEGNTVAEKPTSFVHAQSAAL